MYRLFFIFFVGSVEVEESTGRQKNRLGTSPGGSGKRERGRAEKKSRKSGHSHFSKRGCDSFTALQKEEEENTLGN